MTTIPSFVLDAIVKVTVLLALCSIAALLMKRSSAATRHLLRTSTLAAILILPVFVALLPSWRVAILPARAIVSTEPLPSIAPAVPQPVFVEKQAKPSIRHSRSERWATSTERPVRETTVATQTSATAKSSPAGAAFTITWQTLGLIAWLAGVMLLASRFALGRLRLAALVQRAHAIHEQPWQLQLQQIAQEMGLQRPVALLASGDTDVPLTTGVLHPKVILSADYGEWLPLRREAILRHELAHVKRFDVISQTLAQAVTALYWFHPLVWLTVRAVHAERERACDDYVLAAGTKPSEYAHELLEIASSLQRPQFTAALAMARQSQLEGRVLALLNPMLRRGSVSRKVGLGVTTLTLGLVLPLAALQPASQSAQASAPPPKPSAAQPQSSVPPPPASAPDREAPPALPGGAANPPAVAPEPPETPETPEIPETPETPEPPAAPTPQSASEIDGCVAAHNHNMSIDENDGRRSWIALWTGDDCSIDIKAGGEVRLNAEATSIESISPGGFFEVNERRGAELRHLRITPSANGLQYSYRLNDADHPFDENARAWFSRFLLSVERNTGMAVDSRVPALLKKGGPTAVLDEINNLRGDYVRGLYFRKLLEEKNLPAPVVVRIMKQAGEQLTSDYEMARVLMQVSDQYQLADESSRTAFLTAANHLNSDYEHSRVLLGLLKRPNLSRENIHMALNSAANIKSDYEKSRILVTLAESKTFDEKDISTYLNLVPAIHSDYEKSRSLIALMKSYGVSSASMTKILEATSTIGSDYEKSRLLTAMAQMNTFSEAQIENYLKIVDSINSDYERSRSLLALLERAKLSAAGLTRVLDAGAHIKSDYEKSQFLVAVAQKYPMEGALREKYISTANSISSDYERKRALAAVVKTASI